MTRQERKRAEAKGIIFWLSVILQSAQSAFRLFSHYCMESGLFHATAKLRTSISPPLLLEPSFISRNFNRFYFMHRTRLAYSKFHSSVLLLPLELMRWSRTPLLLRVVFFFSWEDFPCTRRNNALVQQREDTAQEKKSPDLWAIKIARCCGIVCMYGTE